MQTVATTVDVEAETSEEAIELAKEEACDWELAAHENIYKCDMHVETVYELDEDEDY